MHTDLIGKQFSRLTVLEVDGKNIASVPYFKCRCQCGNITKVVKSNLVYGHTKSCGCLRKEWPGYKAYKLAKEAALLSLILFISGCGDSLVDVNTDVGKQDIQNLQKSVEAATTAMAQLQKQNADLEALLQQCQTGQVH